MLALPVVVAVVARAVAAAVVQVARGRTAAEDARAAPEKSNISTYVLCMSFAKLFSSLVLVFCFDAGLAIF